MFVRRRTFANQNITYLYLLLATTRCNLAQINRRHMILARFKKPMNMGENAHHVRLFVLVLVPTKEKSTKDQLETGRTFATMLTDSQFRLRLLSAIDETQFKAFMVARAQQLARSKQLKNRHKYILDPATHESLSSGQRSASALSHKQASWSTRTNINNNDNHHEKHHSMSDKVPEEPLVFHKNPRTSKLFELISGGGGAGNEQAVYRLRELNGQPEQFVRTTIAGADAGTPAAEKRRLAELESAAEELAKRNASSRLSCCAKLAHLCGQFEFGRSAWEDFTRRLSYYKSDFRDGFVGPPRTVQKTIATVWFLYFGILLPTIAFSSLNTTQTQGHMGDLRKALFGQAVGGLGFALLGGQPLVIIMTTAPLCLYTKGKLTGG